MINVAVIRLICIIYVHCMIVAFIPSVFLALRLVFQVLKAPLLPLFRVNIGLGRLLVFFTINLAEVDCFVALIELIKAAVDCYLIFIICEQMLDATVIIFTVLRKHGVFRVVT